MEQGIELKRNSIEKEPVSFVDIEFAGDGISQKFVCMSSHDGKDEFIASYPESAELKYHMNILMKFVDAYKDTYKITHRGGGNLVKSGDTITVSGTSTQLGDFDKEITKRVLEKNFPNIKIIIE